MSRFTKRAYLRVCPEKRRKNELGGGRGGWVLGGVKGWKFFSVCDETKMAENNFTHTCVWGRKLSEEKDE